MACLWLLLLLRLTLMLLLLPRRFPYGGRC